MKRFFEVTRNKTSSHEQRTLKQTTGTSPSPGLAASPVLTPGHHINITITITININIDIDIDIDIHSDIDINSNINININILASRIRCYNKNK